MFPSLKFGEACQNFLQAYAPRPLKDGDIRVVRFDVVIPKHAGPITLSPTPTPPPEIVELYVVFFPVDFARLGKSFWQHTGVGIPSRMAEYCLAILSLETTSAVGVASGHLPSLEGPGHSYPTPPLTPPVANVTKDDNGQVNRKAGIAYDDVQPFHPLPIAEAIRAKKVIRDRIADLVVGNRSISDSNTQRSITSDDVVLFPTGMSAIWHTHLAVVECFPRSKSVCFG